MSEEELRQYCKDASNEIIKLGEENAQLKKEYQTELDEKCKLSELWKDSQVENRQLKGVLKEIREYIKEKSYDNKQYCFDLNNKDIVHILEIIDKGIK